VNVVRKKIKMEIILAVTLAISLSISVIYLSQPRCGTRWYAMPLSFQSKTSWESGLSNVEKIVEENIVGELRKGFFETVIEDIKNLTFHYGGRMPYLNMIYEDDLWSGWMKCKVPSENMTMFTFDVRRLIDEYGKVTYITVRVTEIEANQTQPPETHFSEVTISLKELIEGQSPILSQLATVTSYLTTALIWIVQGIIFGVPLCFASLGVVMLVDRAIIPIWKKQFKGKSLGKSTA